MSQYQFEMADDGTHARVLFGGKVIGTIQNVPDYLGGGLSFGSDGRHEPHKMPGDDMWDAFDAWIDSTQSTTTANSKGDA